MGSAKSGRKPLLQERTLEELLALSGEILQRWLSNPEVPIDRKIPVVTQMIVKRIPAKMEHSGELLKAIFINYANATSKREVNSDSQSRV